MARELDPIAEAEKKAAAVQASAEKAAARITFAEYVEIFLPWKTKGFSNPKHIAQWGMSLRKYAAPLGPKPLPEISRHDILEVLKPMWDTKHVSASRLRGRLENLFDHAIQNGAYHGDNPARWELFNSTLSPTRKLTGSHRPAMPRKDLPEFIQELRAQKYMGALALEFLILTAARSGEVRLACWEEFDLDKELWEIPADRMKMRRPHVVPLCPRVVEILVEAKAIRSTALTADGYVFEGAKAGRPMSDMTIRAVLRRMKQSQYVPHGFRSTFRDWAANDTEFPRELAEEALAHALGSVERAYRREQAVDRRRALMLAWQGFVDGAASGAENVVRLSGHRA